jgi:hypothetical protein
VQKVQEASDCLNFLHFVHFLQRQVPLWFFLGYGVNWRAGRPTGLLEGRGVRKILRSTLWTIVEQTRLQNLRQAPRCGARTRGGTPCQRPAIRGRKRCRLHGGLSPGAPRGQKNGNFKTGDWTIEAIQERKWLRSLVQSIAHPERSK